MHIFGANRQGRNFGLPQESPLEGNLGQLKELRKEVQSREARSIVGYGTGSRTTQPSSRRKDGVGPGMRRGGQTIGGPLGQPNGYTETGPQVEEGRKCSGGLK